MLCSGYFHDSSIVIYCQFTKIRQCVLLAKCRKWVFSKFSLWNFRSNQSLSLFIYHFTFDFSLSQSLASRSIAVSPAKLKIEPWTFKLSRLFIYKQNNSGPIAVPCGITWLIFLSSLRVWLLSQLVLGVQVASE